MDIFGFERVKISSQLKEQSEREEEGELLLPESEKKRRRRMRARELPVCLGLWVCVCVLVQLSECMRTDTWCSPSFAAHIVESSLAVWAVLYLSLFSLLFPPSLFCPLLSAFPPTLSFFPSFYNLCFLFRISFTMLQDFYCLSRRALD